MNVYIRSLKYVKPYWKLLLVGAIITLILFAISLIPPFFTKVLIDRVLMVRDVALLNKLFAGIIIVFFIDLALGFANHYLFVKMEQSISYDVRTAFFHHLQKLGMRFYDSNRGGNLIYRLFGDTEAIPHAVSSVIVELLLHIITLAVVSAILLAMNWKLSILCFLIIPLHIASIIGFRKPIITWSRRLRHINEKISGNVVEYFSNVRLVKALSTEDKERERFSKDQEEKMTAGLKSNLTNKISTLTTGSINNFIFFLVLWYGGLDVMKGNNTLGDLMAFLVLVGRLYVPVSGITGIVLSFQDFMVGMKRYYEIMDLAPDSKDVRKETHSELQRAVGVRGNIEFNNVSFGYNGGSPVLRNVSFTIAPAEKIALIGRSGVGKTTIVNLLSRFYEPQSGSITIDGRSISQIQIKDLRRQLGIVLQDPYLFSGTVKENIVYGNDGASDGEVIDAAIKANAHEFILTFPHQYDTQIGERGVMLSGGQKQRIALARTFLRDPAILILDEAMSSIDMESELLIQDALRQLTKDRTSIIIAHRLSTIKDSDKILVLHNGSIEEQGSHAELVARQGLYYQMHERLAKISA